MGIKVLISVNDVLAKVAAGDHRAFCSLFDHYHGYVYAFGRKLTRSDDLAEEIVQEIFLKLWIGRRDLSSVENFEAYLTRIVQNRAYNFLRRTNTYMRVTNHISKEADMAITDLNHDLDYRESLSLLEEAVGSLPEQQRQAYELCHQQGMKYEDAAKVMGVSPDTVHYHIKKALKSIRMHFKSYSLYYPVFISCLFR